MSFNCKNKSVPLKILRMVLADGSQVPMPKYATSGSAGFDLYSANLEPVVLKPGETKVIPLGIKVELPEGYELQLRPRSGLAAKYGITLPNAPSTIDSDYRGEVGVILTNLGNEDFEVLPFMRICQGIVKEVPKIDFIEVDSLSETDRGDGSYGSTGLK